MVIIVWELVIEGLRELEKGESEATRSQLKSPLKQKSHECQAGGKPMELETLPRPSCRSFDVEGRGATR